MNINAINNVEKNITQFRIPNSEFRIKNNSQFRIPNSEFRIKNNSEFRIPNSELKIVDEISIGNKSENKVANTYSPPKNIQNTQQNSTKEKIDIDNPDEREFRELFHKFIGQTLFGQMLKSMRATQQKNPYFHGGRAEEIFQDELDNKLVEQLTNSTTKNLSEPMYNQFQRQRG
ncbi:MAG: rod-binding protein [Planctomycetaceae bacterium]|jgi:hypothetical protein|nr:rod-binding protein [Planctomycetaceae bacterium]